MKNKNECLKIFHFNFSTSISPSLCYGVPIIKFNTTKFIKLKQQINESEIIATLPQVKFEESIQYHLWLHSWTC